MLVHSIGRLCFRWNERQMPYLLLIPTHVCALDASYFACNKEEEEAEEAVEEGEAE